ncbi:MAG: DUF6445 family protein [Inhella sp.]|uniref:DUF6445 family protein n=1 Tax=Inhella sp. TaxID=1921806 RepID=UPI0022C613FD|nr:DUF6445 family protein [Inhella sp.]MCZ8236127.1 DUF6445 family protein [Inhella sp.]
MRPLQLPAAGRFFNAQAVVQDLHLGRGRTVHVIDDALVDPQAVVDWAALVRFDPPQTNAYPGGVTGVPEALRDALDGFFAQHLRTRMGARRTLDMYARLSMVTLSPAQLRPGQWLCHKDRTALDPSAVLMAASVLYLFHDPALGGTAFFEPRRSAAEIQALVDDAQTLDNARFADRYGVAPGYLTESNDYFEKVAEVPARWNRLIFYDGGLFHSGCVRQPVRLTDDPRTGRLTLNGFFGCRRVAR